MAVTGVADLRAHVTGAGVAMRVVVVSAVEAGLTVIQGGPHTVPDNRLFELASLTKVLTSTVLAGLHRKGVVRLDSAVADVLPAMGTNPLWRTVTLAGLARHETGLPRLSKGIRRSGLLHPRDPYARYGAQDLERDMLHEPAAVGAGNRRLLELRICRPGRDPRGRGPTATSQP